MKLVDANEERTLFAFTEVTDDDAEVLTLLGLKQEISLTDAYDIEVWVKSEYRFPF